MPMVGYRNWNYQNQTLHNTLGHVIHLFQTISIETEITMRQINNRVRQIQGGGDALHLESRFLFLLILVLCTCVFIVSFRLRFTE